MKKFSKILALALAALSMVLVFAACGNKKGDVVVLKWVTVGNGMPDNYSAWQEKMNEYLEEKIGVHIDVEVIGWGDWDQRRQVIVGTGSDFDIVFGNSGTYNTDIQTNAYLDITEMIDKNAGDLKKFIPDNYWEACRVDGKIYGIPTYKDSSQSEFIVWDKQLAADHGIDTASIHELKDLTAPLQKIKDETGETPFPLSKSGATYLMYMYDQMSAGLPALGVRYDDASAKVVPVFEQADVMEYLDLYHSWYNSGIINADAATKPEENNYKICSIAQGWAGAAITSWGPNMGVDAEAYQWGPTIVSNETVRGSLNSISSSCKNPEKALEFLQLVNLDTWVRDSFYYGLEGDDWEYTDDGRVHRIKTDWKMAGYTQGTFFNVTQLDDVDFNQWDEVKALNEGAEASVLLGFTFDTKSISDQLSNCTVIYESYRGELLTGTREPGECVEAMMKEMRAAGFDDILAEAQTQVDAFMAG